MKDAGNPMSKAHAAPRCTATSKRTGERCKGPAKRGWSVCRFHGAGGGHKPGSTHPKWRHGATSKEAVNQRKAATKLIKETQQLIDEIGQG